MPTWTTVPQTGFESIRLLFYKEDGQTLRPDWVTTRRIEKTPIPGAGEYVQLVGWNRDSLVVIAETDDDADARALVALLGTEHTLTLSKGIGSIRGTAIEILGEGFEDIPLVTLAALEPLGMRLNGRFRFRATFERDHPL